MWILYETSVKRWMWLATFLGRHQVEVLYPLCSCSWAKSIPLPFQCLTGQSDWGLKHTNQQSIPFNNRWVDWKARKTCERKAGRRWRCPRENPWWSETPKAWPEAPAKKYILQYDLINQYLSKLLCFSSAKAGKGARLWTFLGTLPFPYYSDTANKSFQIFWLQHLAIRRNIDHGSAPTGSPVLSAICAIF